MGATTHACSLGYRPLLRAWVPLRLLTRACGSARGRVVSCTPSMSIRRSARRKSPAPLAPEWPAAFLIRTEVSEEVTGPHCSGEARIGSMRCTVHARIPTFCVYVNCPSDARGVQLYVRARAMRDMYRPD